MASSHASRWTLLDSVIQLARYRRVLPLIPTGGIVADLGCGNGDLARILSNRARTVYGVDFHVGRVTAHRNVSFCEGNLNEHIPLKSESVDICVSLAVLEHLSAANVFVTEVQRVLKPGGRVIITTPTPRAKPILEFLACRLKVISEDDIRDHKHYYEPEEIRSLFTSFTNVSISIPMDEALASVVVDLSNRAYLVYQVPKLGEKVGEFEVQLFPEFFRAFAQNAGATLHITVLYGDNTHHIGLVGVLQT